MEEIMHNFHFLRPQYLWLLLAPLLLWIGFYKNINQTSSWEKVIDAKLLKYLLIKGSAGMRKLSIRIGFWGIIFAILAAAGPTWKKVEIAEFSSQNPVMILLNMSSDMAEQDLSPNRLERAKFKIKDLLSLLSGTEIGLIVYSNEPYLISPITEDVNLIDNLLPELNFDIMPQNGDRLDRAIDFAVQKLIGAGYDKGNIIIFAAEIGQRLDLSIQAAKRAKTQGFTVNVEGIRPSDTEKLEMIAQNGGGIYNTISASDNDIKTLAAKILQTKSELKEGNNKKAEWLDYGYYLVFIPLLCCAYFFRKGFLIAAFLLFIAPTAHASIFQNADQKGKTAFDNGQFKQAAQLFKDKSWQGSSLYKAGKFEEAYQKFSDGKDIETKYNAANALAKSGKIKEAIALYEQILEVAPQHEDAKFNLEYLKKQQQNQQNQNNNQQQNKEQQKQSQEQQSAEQNQNDQQNKDSQPEQNSSQQQEQTPQPQNEEQNNNNQNSNTEQQSLPIIKEDQKTSNMPADGLQKADEEPKYDEQVQAKEQQYREIPDNPGGLLKAYIQKEYLKKRYQ